MTTKLGDPSYLGRVLRLTLLAPDIVEAMIGDREVSQASLTEVLKPMSVLWEEQRRKIGVCKSHR
jgi:hypothetical protein